MIAEIGHFALIAAFLLAGLQSTVPLYGAHKGDRGMMELARSTAVGQFVLVLLAFAALVNAFVTSDFSVLNVAQNSHSLKPMLYKISGTWGNHEGSLLLWALILSLFGAMVACFGRNLPPSLRARTLAIQGMIALGFLAFMLFTSNPFDRILAPPPDGAGLNPLLQDPGLAFHPPFLYFGYVGLSISFSFAVAALIEGKVDAAWARWVRPWTLAAWCGLTVGIGLGSWWAYYELGWGGFWFWDPVENASFMPWLAATALLHSAIVVEKRDALKSWTILLAIVAFSLSLLGTFLVRSGVLTSVHAFATDPERGVFILGLLGVAIGGSLTLFAIRAPKLQASGVFQPISREGALLLNNLFLSAAAATVLLGTLYPLFLDVLDAGKVSVGPPFFNATFGPLMAPVLTAMVIGPFLSWKRADLRHAMQKVWLGVAAGVGAIVLTLILSGVEGVLPAVGVGAAVWIIAGTLLELAERVKLFRVPLGETWRRARRTPRAAYGMTVAHLGVGLVVAGVLGATVFKTESIQSMKPGDAAIVAGYTFTLDRVERIQGPNYLAERGVFRISEGGKEIATVNAERRNYPVENEMTTEAGIHTTWVEDLYAVIGEGAPGGGWTTRLYHNPLVPWIWLGTIIMSLGGVISLTDRRLRIGAPTRRRAAVGGAAPAPAE
jgi:cytochrome c-type biogenesis protein CcmF